MGAAKSIVHLLHEVAAKAKEILRESVHCQKPLTLRGGSKTAPMILLLPHRLMWAFAPVIRLNLIEVVDRRHHRPMGGIIALQFVSHGPLWFTTLAFEETTKEAFRRCSVASGLDIDINRVAALIHDPPQIVLATKEPYSRLKVN